MKAERWQQIDKVFQDTLEIEPALRSAFLDKACTGNQTLRSEVESLLSVDSADWDFIESPALEKAASLLADEQPQLTVGQTVAHYQIVSLIGIGGMGEVYLAKDLRLNRSIALKVLPVDYTRNIDRLRRFQQEAQAASALNHPNILTIHELVEVDQQQFIATEFVEGETLRSRLKQGALGLREAVDISIQIVSAIAAAHKAGIVHRDIKPENIMLRPDGYVKVLDFGLAKLTAQEEQIAEVGVVDNLIASSSMVMGTLKYMSPEQASSLPVDQRSDIFSIGVVVYEMISGHTPFKGEAAGAMINSILKDEPARLTESRPDTPEALQHIVDRCLNKDRENRYQSAADLALDLKTLTHISQPGPDAQRNSTHNIRAQRPQMFQASTPTESVEATSTKNLVVTPSKFAYLVNQLKEHKTGAITLGLIAIVTVIITLAFPLRRLFNNPASSSASKMKAIKLTTNGKATSAAISRDGRYVAYGEKDGGKHSLWIKEIGTPSVVQILPPNELHYRLWTFSSDGKHLYYSIAGDTGNTIYQIPSSGGSPRQILTGLRSGIGVSSDGSRLVFQRSNFDEGLSGIFISNADGTGEKELASRKAPNYFDGGSTPSWSPDGRSIACVGIDPNDGYPRIIEVKVDSGLQRPLTSQKWNLIIDIAWLSDSSGLIVTAEAEVHSQIWHVSYPSGEAHQLTNDVNDYYRLSISEDSEKLVTVHFDWDVNIWILSGADIAHSKQVTFGRYDGFGGVAGAADGKVVFESAVSNNDDIWIVDQDGKNLRQLTTDSHKDVEPSVSEDGRFIAFSSNRTGAEHVWLMDIDGRNQRQLTSGSVERSPQFSADSKWVVYNGWESGKATVWRIPIDGGTPMQITNMQSFAPVVSPDGKSIAYISRDKRGLKIGISPYAGGHQTKTFEITDLGFSPIRWTRDGQALTFVRFRDGVKNIWSQPLDGGPPKQLTNFTTENLWHFDWSRDGKSLACVLGPTISSVVLLSGFRDK